MYFKKPPPVFAPQMSVKMEKTGAFCPQNLDYMGLNALRLSSAPLWLLHQFQFFQGCYLLCHGAPPTALTLLSFESALSDIHLS